MRRIYHQRIFFSFFLTFFHLFVCFIKCRVSGARYPANPAKAKTDRLTIANRVQAIIRRPLQGEHCRSQRFYRHSCFYWYLTTTMSDSAICLYCVCRNCDTPVCFIGGGAGYRPRVQNDYSASGSESSSHK